jgi:hypothetical protein
MTAPTRYYFINIHGLAAGHELMVCGTVMVLLPLATTPRALMKWSVMT